MSILPIAVNGYVWGGVAWMILCIVRQRMDRVPALLRIVIGLCGGFAWGMAAAPLVKHWQIQATPELITVGGSLFVLTALFLKTCKEHCLLTDAHRDTL